MLIHGWTAGPLLLEFVEYFKPQLEAQAMTVEELATTTGAHLGPLAILLRTCRILGYVRFDVDTSQYSLVRGTELDELDAQLRPSSGTAQALRSFYADVELPFEIDSKEASQCLSLWSEQRHMWNSSKSSGLAILLDGVVLAPLLTSITYTARWNEEGVEKSKDYATDKFDFSKLDVATRALLGDIFEEVGVGTISSKGVMTMSSKGTLALQRCYSYYVPVSYYPMLAQLHTILFEDAGWGFVGAGQDVEETEEHVDRVLNVIGSGVQHRTLFKDLMKHVHSVFSGNDFKSQPRFIVDTGCGDGSLLLAVYEYVKSSTPRGQVLQEFPLTVVGVDFNEESRMAAAVNLSKQGVQSLIFHGDIGKPADIIEVLKRRSVDLERTLHVRSFLDHDRPYIAPATRLAEGTAVAAFARKQLSDFVHLDKHGTPIGALDVYASLVEHFCRWSTALEGSCGLCMLEVMMLDAPTTQRFFNDSVSFHFDIVQSLSRQYMVSPVAFAMAAATAGLFPKNFDTVETYPEQGKYCRILNQHLVQRRYRIRFAELSDLERLVELESVAWAEHMVASPEVLRRRLETSPTTNLVLETSGRVMGVLYMQLVDGLDVVDQERYMRISDFHSPSGRLLQLIAINVQEGLGTELKNFALHLARLDQNVESVIGVTRCKGFHEYGGSMQAYVDEHLADKLHDGTLGFHTDAGARVLRLVPGFRPEDRDNSGTGVLIQYKVKEAKPSGKQASTVGGKDASPSTVPTLYLLEAIMDDLGFPLDMNDLGRGFFDYGMDSLELVRIRNKLSSILDMDLPATLLLDCPTVQDLVSRLDSDRAVGLKTESSVEAEPETKGESKGAGWEAMDPPRLLQLQERFRQVLAQPNYQKRFTEIAKKSYPDMMRYIIFIEPVLLEIEGPILRDFGLVHDTDLESVQESRTEYMKLVTQYWWKVPEIRNKFMELMRLTKQDQNWGWQN